jgi:hypothetical protein
MIFVTAGLEIESREERERERASQHRGQRRKTEFPGSENDKQEKQGEENSM